MKTKIFIYVFFTLFLILISYFIINKLNKHQKNQSISEIEENSYTSNIIKNVNYSSKDSKGNEYVIDAEEGEIDYSNPNIIYLKNVKAVIILENSNNINITSNFGKYNTNNFDTIFSKNVRITYAENKINGEYLDFSIYRNSMIISKNVIYTNLENILKADVIDINIETKDTKIFMHDSKKKVNIKSIN